MGVVTSVGVGLVLGSFVGAGSLDPTFGAGGFVTSDLSGGSDPGHAMAAGTDGRIVIAGESNQRIAVARYLESGSLDPEFGLGGIVITPISAPSSYAVTYASDVEVQPDGRIIAGGISGDSRFSRRTDIVLVRYDPGGSLDPSFGGGIVLTDFGGTYDHAKAIALQDDGKIVAVGERYRDVVGSIARGCVIVRYETNGSLDPTFGEDGVVFESLSECRDVAVQRDGKILATMQVWVASPPQSFDFGVLRLNPDGTRDASFGSSGLTTVDFARGEDIPNTIAIQSDGRIVVAGSTLVARGEPNAAARFKDFALVRLTSGGEIDLGFGVSGRITSDFGSIAERIWSVVVQDDGSIVAGGEISTGEWPGPSFGLARYSPDGALDLSFGSGGWTRTDLGGGIDLITGLSLLESGGILAGGCSDCWYYEGNFALARYRGASTTCGNAILDEGEDCDLGDANGKSSCCAATCRHRTAGAECRSSEGQCDVAEVCDGFSADCPPNLGRLFEDATLRLSRFDTGPGDDRLAFEGRMVVPELQVLDPRSSGVRLVVSRGDGLHLIDVLVPPGPYSKGTRSGWRQNLRGTTFTFTSDVAVGGAVDRAVIRRGTRDPQAFYVTLRGQGGAFASLPALPPLSVAVVIAPSTPASGICGEVSFAPPRCSLRGAGATAVCR